MTSDSENFCREQARIKQAKQAPFVDWKRDDLARQMLHDVWCANVKADRVKGLIKMDKKAEKKE